MERRGMRLTTPAPSHAPAVAVATMHTSSTGCTVTAVTNSRVSRKAAALSPTFSVPGINSSAGLPRNLNSAVVGANEPIPSVSRKVVRQPMAMSGRSGRPRRRWRRAAQTQPMTKAILTRTSASRSPALAALVDILGPEGDVRSQATAEARQPVHEAQVLDRGTRADAAQCVEWNRQHGRNREAEFDYLGTECAPRQ